MGDPPIPGMQNTMMQQKFSWVFLPCVYFGSNINGVFVQEYMAFDISSTSLHSHCNYLCDCLNSWLVIKLSCLLQVFLEYADVDGATKARTGMNGRKFGGNQVVAVFYPENKFAQGDYEG